MSNDSDELKVIDLGCAQRYNPKRKAYCEYGTPEFVSPEIASHEHVTPASDLWSVGVISYIILSGISPFHCPVAKDTLLKVQTGKFEFNTEAFATISNDAKDFISKLLVKDPSKRMTASQALEHRFMELAFQRGLGDRIPVDRLKSYSFRRKCERGITSVKTIVQPVPLSSYMQEVPAIAATEGISIDIPDVPELAVDAATGAIGLAPSANMPEAGASGMLQVMGPPSLLSGAPSTVGSGSSSEWGREYEDEDSWYEWSSEYTSGPDAHLVPSSDTGLSLRLRQYRRTKGGPSGPSASYRLTKKERRDLRDIDKEAHDYNRPTNNRTSIWQLKSMVDAGNTLEGKPALHRVIRCPCMCVCCRNNVCVHRCRTTQTAVILDSYARVMHANPYMRMLNRLKRLYGNRETLLTACNVPHTYHLSRAACAPVNASLRNNQFLTKELVELTGKSSITCWESHAMDSSPYSAVMTMMMSYSEDCDTDVPLMSPPPRTHASETFDLDEGIDMQPNTKPPVVRPHNLLPGRLTVRASKLQDVPEVDGDPNNNDDGNSSSSPASTPGTPITPGTSGTTFHYKKVVRRNSNPKSKTPERKQEEPPLEKGMTYITASADRKHLKIHRGPRLAVLTEQVMACTARVERRMSMPITSLSGRGSEYKRPTSGGRRQSMDAAKNQMSPQEMLHFALLSDPTVINYRTMDTSVGPLSKYLVSFTVALLWGAALTWLLVVGGRIASRYID